MARGTSSRSRNTSPAPRSRKSSQAASGKASGSRRNRRDADEEEDEEDVDLDDVGDASQDGQNTIESRANDLVRLALFTESSRGSFKRDDINKKVLSGNTRSFNAVFERAQQILRKTFGMEIHELMTRVERDKAMAPENNTTNATSGKATKVSSSSKTYILRSALPSQLLQAMVDPDLAIRHAAYGAREKPDNEREEDRPDDTLVAWKHSDNMAIIGILHVVLALILANGRSIPDPQLRAQLKKLGLKSGVQIPQPAHSAFQKTLTLDSLLTYLTKTGYLDRQRVSTGGEPNKGRKRAAAGGEDGEGNAGDDYEWKWGTRAIGEINEVGVATLVQEFMGDRFHEREVEIEAEEGPSTRQAGDGGEEEGGKSEARLKHETAVMNDLVRGAGGPLLKIRVHRIRDGSEEPMNED